MSVTNNLLMTGKECTEYFTAPIIVLLIALTLFAVALVYFAYKHTLLSDFIKEKKLQKEYQEYRKNNKGLLL